MTKLKWEDMTRAERRVAVAKDVLGQIASKNLKIEKGYYFYPNQKTKNKMSKCTKTQEAMQCVLNEGKCVVCARGAMMVSKLAKFNNVQMGVESWQFTEKQNTLRALKDCFSNKQLSKIEACFERCVTFLKDPNKYTDYYEKFCFYCDWGPDNPEERLICIMQNIIDHNGEFKPEVQYEIYNV